VGTIVRERLRKARAQVPYIPDTFRLIWASSRSWTIGWALLLFLQGLLPVGLVYLSGAIADSLAAFVKIKDWAGFLRLLPWVGLILLLLLLRQSLGSLLSWVRTVQGERVQDHIFDRIHAKAIELDLSFYDSTDYYNRLYRASVDAYDRPVALLENVGSLIQNALTFGAMAVILLRFAWWLPIVLLVGMAPVLWVVTRFTVREYEWRQHSTEPRRRANYLDWLITDRRAAAELRLFGIGDLFRVSYQAIRARLRADHAALARSQAISELVAGSLALLTAGIVMLWMIRRLVAGYATFGDAAILYQAFSQGQGLIQTLLGSVGQILKNVLFVDNLFVFLRMQPQQPALPVSRLLREPLTSGIRFAGVTFHYPGSEHAALQDFDLSVRLGQVAAIVGENGAGKSTVLKLLCRFYDPDEGHVSINGIDLREIEPAEIWQHLTTLFQEPIHYDESAHMNIALGQHNPPPSDASVAEAAKAAGADDLIRALPDGYQTVLGKWFGGAELSSGEWQRVALARAFLRKAPIMLLDEPTSAMDSWAEADWMLRFRRLAANRTAILITHRFTTAMQADVIHVMSDGQIIESGNHLTLLQQGGRYAQSWLKQMRLAQKMEQP
jgi:ATP-binding cassette subfamily B protein